MSYRSNSFEWESIQVWTIRRLCSKASQPLISLCVVDREVTDVVPSPSSSFKVQRIRGDKDQWPNSNPCYIQTEVILRHPFTGVFSPHVGFVWKFGEGVLAQVSPSSRNFDQDFKLVGPPQKRFSVTLNRDSNKQSIRSLMAVPLI
ncbi:hypothetical protein TNCV_1675581 [Trichonephila clavipes]|nr:hypothetical protein TNCV_1675581 [Trichonephila clavipes]